MIKQFGFILGNMNTTIGDRIKMIDHVRRGFVNINESLRSGTCCGVDLLTELHKETKGWKNEFYKCQYFEKMVEKVIQELEKKQQSISKKVVIRLVVKCLNETNRKLIYQDIKEMLGNPIKWTKCIPFLNSIELQYSGDYLVLGPKDSFCRFEHSKPFKILQDIVQSSGPILKTLPNGISVCTKEFFSDGLPVQIFDIPDRLLKCESQKEPIEQFVLCVDMVSTTELRSLCVELSKAIQKIRPFTPEDCHDLSWAKSFPTCVIQYKIHMFPAFVESIVRPFLFIERRINSSLKSDGYQVIRDRVIPNPRVSYARIQTEKSSILLSDSEFKKSLFHSFDQSKPILLISNSDTLEELEFTVFPKKLIAFTIDGILDVSSFEESLAKIPVWQENIEEKGEGLEEKETSDDDFEEQRSMQTPEHEVIHKYIDEETKQTTPVETGEDVNETDSSELPLESEISCQLGDKWMNFELTQQKLLLQQHREQRREMVQHQEKIFLLSHQCRGGPPRKRRKIHDKDENPDSDNPQQPISHDA